MQVGNDRNPWFALQVHTRRENTVADLLRFRGCDPFLPLHMERRRWSDRIKKVEAPLFPGYLFCRLSDRNQAAALFTYGVIRILGPATCRYRLKRTRWRDTRRSLLPLKNSTPTTTQRATERLATPFALCQASYARRPLTGRSFPLGNRPARPSAAPAHRFTEAGSVTG